jgi:hypothetical protein
MKTAELTGALLDFWVAKANGWTLKKIQQGVPSSAGEGPGRFREPPPDATVESAWGYWHDARGRVISLLRYGQIKECDWKPSTDWGLGGPLIASERIALYHDDSPRVSSEPWIAGFDMRIDSWNYESDNGASFELDHSSAGPTPLVAAMRAYVARKFGDTVEQSTIPARWAQL